VSEPPTKASMNVLKAILAGEVYPAMGCTEPVSCAYAAALAAERLGETVQRLSLKADLGTFKNGSAVAVPHAEGAKGNPIAAAMGALLANSESKLELLGEVTPAVSAAARELLHAGRCDYTCLEDEREFRVDVTVFGAEHSARCVLSGGHTDIERIERDAQVLSERDPHRQRREPAYRAVLRKMSLRELIEVATGLDDDDRQYIQRGIDMNLAMARRGDESRQAAYYLRRMKEKGILSEDLFYRVKVPIASAVDARMAGAAQAVMTSGGSGNQGIVAILTPHLVGQDRGTASGRILESIAAAHATNAYIKCYLGELSVTCGCAIAAGIAASVAVVYQHAGIDIPKMTFAVNNVIGDLSGLVCDGAKPGCSMKVVTSVDAAMRAAFMAIEGFGISDDDGLLGRTAEDSIRNLGRLSLDGMARVDPTVVDILTHKADRNRDPA